MVSLFSIDPTTETCTAINNQFNTHCLLCSTVCTVSDQHTLSRQWSNTICKYSNSISTESLGNDTKLKLSGILEDQETLFK